MQPLPPAPMKPGVVSKLFDIPKIAPQIHSWEFEPQRKGILRITRSAFSLRATCVLCAAAIFLFTLSIAFLLSPEKHLFPPTNRYLSGKRGNCLILGAVCSKNFVKRGV